MYINRRTYGLNAANHVHTTLTAKTSTSWRSYFSQITRKGQMEKNIYISCFFFFLSLSIYIHENIVRLMFGKKKKKDSKQKVISARVLIY